MCNLRLDLVQAALVGNLAPGWNGRSLLQRFARLMGWTLKGTAP